MQHIPPETLGLDQFEGRTWKGRHHHVTMVLLAYAYLALQRAQRPGNPKPTLQETTGAIVLEMATQDLVRKQRFQRTKARSVARTLLRGFSEWDG